MPRHRKGVAPAITPRHRDVAVAWVARNPGATKPTITSWEDAAYAAHGDGWRDQARCQGQPYDTFYPDRTYNYRAARVICAFCPVSATCAAWGAFDPHGMIGGRDPSERAADRKALLALIDQAQRPADPGEDCGKEAGWYRHRRNGERPCVECEAVHKAAVAHYYYAAKDKAS